MDPTSPAPPMCVFHSLQDCGSDNEQITAGQAQLSKQVGRILGSIETDYRHASKSHCRSYPHASGYNVEAAGQNSLRKRDEYRCQLPDDMISTHEKLEKTKVVTGVSTYNKNAALSDGVVRSPNTCRALPRKRYVPSSTPPIKDCVNVATLRSLLSTEYSLRPNFS